jgi:hypothetical protein
MIKGHHRPALRPRGKGAKLALSCAMLAMVALICGASTFSAMNDTSVNASNSFTAGSVKLGNNTGATAMLSLSGAKPGSSVTGCINLTYSGTLPATVKLYDSLSGTGLDAYLTLTVTRGTFSGTPAAGSCTGFTADSTNYAGLGAGIIYSGTLTAFPQSASSALGDPTTASPATWSNGTAHGYELQVTLQNNNAAQGLNATANFTWEADNT